MTGDLTTLANVKQWLNIPDSNTNDDALLTRMVSALSGFVQKYINRTIASASYTDVIDGIGQSRGQFANYPVTAVASISVQDQTIQPANSTTSYGYVWSSTQWALQSVCVPRGFGNVVVNYTAGFATTPLDLEQAVIEVLGLRYKERDRIGYVSKSLAGETVTFSLKDMPASTQTLLDSYKRMAPL
jgi:hypothetical protein